MATHRVSRGRKSQQIAADFLREQFPGAESIAASLPGRDVLNTEGWALEVKATKEFKPSEFMRQACKNSGDDFAFAIYRPNGYGPERVHLWTAMTTLGELRDLINYVQQLERIVSSLPDSPDLDALRSRGS